jgi:hypothetical protein
MGFAERNIGAAEEAASQAGKPVPPAPSATVSFYLPAVAAAMASAGVAATTKMRARRGGGGWMGCGLPDPLFTPAPGPFFLAQAPGMGGFGGYGLPACSPLVLLPLTTFPAIDPAAFARVHIAVSMGAGFDPGRRPGLGGLMGRGGRWGGGGGPWPRAYEPPAGRA